MRRMFTHLKLRSRIKAALLDTGVTGEIKFHDAKLNLAFLRRMQKQDPYVTFGIAEVHNAMRRKAFSISDLVAIMANSLGIEPERYTKPGPAYIAPELTADRMMRGFDLIKETIADGKSILIATEHPGSMLGLYTRLVDYVRDHDGRLYVAPEPFPIEYSRWIDTVASVHVMSDRGSLYHSHESSGFWQFLASINEPPGLVIADHGFAGAAINRDIPTMAFHDVDDGGIVLAAHIGLKVLAVPMNDNQLNQPTLAALEAILEQRA